MLVSIVAVYLTLNLLRKYESNIFQARTSTNPSVLQRTGSDTKSHQTKETNIYLYVFGNLLSQG